MWVLLLGLAVLAILIVLSLWKGARVYKSGERISALTALYVWVSYILHAALTAYAAYHEYWPLPLNRRWLIVTGTILVLTGSAISIAGVVEFRSYKRMSGLMTNKFVTSGIYRWSRNPQNAGWGLALTGIALIGGSGAALVLAFLFWLIIHFYIIGFEENYLIQLFGKQYLDYCATTPRYFGLPRTGHSKR